MIKTHEDILNLWPSIKILAKRIRQEYPNRITRKKEAQIANALRVAKHRNKISLRHWKYIMRVSAADYEKGVNIEPKKRAPNQQILVTSDLLLDTDSSS